MAVLILQVSPDDPPGRFAQWLRDAGLEVDVWLALSAGEVPGEADRLDALIVLGRSHVDAESDAASGEASTAVAVEALLRSAAAADVPTLGIGLGAQYLALAHGGQVQPVAAGPQLGPGLIAKRTAAATDPLFGSLPITPDVLAWRHATITRLPPGAVHLAASPDCENEAFRVGRLAWAIAFHVEADPEVLRGWARDGAATGEDPDRLVTGACAVDADIVEVWTAFAAAFAAVVRDPDAVPPPRGPRVSAAAPITDPAAIRAALAAEATAAQRPAHLPMPGLGQPGLRQPRDG